MIGSLTSILVVVTSTMCEAFQQTPRRSVIPYLLGYNSNIAIFKNMGTNQRFSSAATNSADSSKRTDILPLVLSTITQSEHLVQNRRRGRRRYMIGDLIVSARDDAFNSCRQICCLPNLLRTPSSSASSIKNSNYAALTTELYCSAINPNDTAIDDSQMSNSEVDFTNRTSWKEKLLEFSTLASILCVIDCTILPILTVLLPLLGMVSAVNTMLPFNNLLHHYGHLMTIYFVLPIGFFATTTNFLYNHRKKWITAIGWFGLLIIFAANTGTGGCGSVVEHVHAHAHIHQHLATSSLSFLDGMTESISSILNTIQHGIYHRITNLSGCAFLIFSNYISHQHQKNHRTTHVHNKGCCTPSPRPTTSTTNIEQ